jgi:hypothetical protein
MPSPPVIRIAAAALSTDVVAAVSRAEHAGVCRAAIDTAEQPLALGQRAKAAYVRILHERRRSRGYDELEADEALKNVVVRTVAALINRDCDAALISADGEQAKSLLEPAGADPIAQVYVGEFRNSDGVLKFGWLPWKRESASELARRLVSATQMLELATNQPAEPTVVSLTAAKEPRDSVTASLITTLAARRNARHVELYSPLFYTNGRFSFKRFIADLRNKLKASPVPVICAPEVATDEFAAALSRTGGVWAGGFMAGAERLLSVIPADAAAGQWSATLGIVAAMAARDGRRAASGE